VAASRRVHCAILVEHTGLWFVPRAHRQESGSRWARDDGGVTPERAASARVPAAAPAIAAMRPAISTPASEVYKPSATNPKTISATVAVIVPTIRPSTTGSYSKQAPLIRVDRC